jgi:hypothetical protein
MNKYTYNLNTFYKEDATTYYLLGAWMTDGNVYVSKDRPNRKCATLISKDENWLHLINDLICPKKPLIPKNNCHIAMYNSTELSDWFIAHKCIPRKSLTLQFPKVPPKYLADFIRGCWDGDGSISFTKSGSKGRTWQRQANLTSGSFVFCNSLCEILNKQGIKCRVYKHGSEERKIGGRALAPSTCWRVVLSGGESVYKLMKWAYYEEHTLSMPRKWVIAQQIIEDWERPILCIECDVVLGNKSQCSSKKRYCNECLRLHINEENRRKYHAKRHHAL